MILGYRYNIFSSVKYKFWFYSQSVVSLACFALLAGSSEVKVSEALFVISVQPVFLTLEGKYSCIFQIPHHTRRLLIDVEIKDIWKGTSRVSLSVILSLENKFSLLTSFHFDSSFTKRLCFYYLIEYSGFPVIDLSEHWKGNHCKPSFWEY